MENLEQVRKIKRIVCCFIVAFVAVFIAVTVSFVQVGKVRRVDAGYNKQIEQLKTQKDLIEDDIDYLESDEGKDEIAKGQDKIPEGKTEIIVE